MQKLLQIKRGGKDLHSHAETPMPFFLTLVHVSNEAGKNYIRVQEPPMPPFLRLYMYQTRQKRITFACRNPLCLLPYAFTCIKRGSAKANTRMQEPPMPPFLRMYQTRQQDLQPPMPPSLHLYTKFNAVFKESCCLWVNFSHEFQV